jgi:malonyl-CoA O-methyltransferase
MTRPSKARVRQSFERAAATYDAAAVVQRQICDRLASGLPALPAIKRILDAGCGTGYAQGLLRACIPNAEIISLDLSAAMLKQIDSPCLRIAGDLEHLPLADHSIDLYWSSLAVQWCDLARALHEARRVLRPQGRLVLATLGQATFQELRAAFNGIDNYQHTLSFHSVAEIATRLQQAGLTAVNIENHQEIAYYPDLRSLLHAVKAVGANQLGSGRRTSLMSRTTLRRVEQAYETRRQPAGLPLTYDIFSIEAKS